MIEAVAERIQKEKLIAILRGISREDIVKTAEALKQGGISCVEITFAQGNPKGEEDTVESIRKLRSHFDGEILAGAGTVMTVEQVHLAAEAGASYIISPNTNEAVIRETKRLGLVSIPGAMTPSEVAAAYQYGADFVKVFPAGVLGTAYIKALRGPMPHIPLMAVGGVSLDNCREFLKAGVVGLGIGGNLASPKMAEEGRFGEIAEMAQKYTEAVRM